MLSKYQEVAKRILAFKDEDFKLGMSYYKSNCGTTFCLAGWLAYQDGYPSGYVNRDGLFSHSAYSGRLIGYSIFDDEWNFLFSPYWASNLEGAKRRAEYILANDDCPDRACWIKEWNYEVI